ncbi:PREDICTED: translocation protein SEC63 homolog [Acropora digitifera]|uniref:translocation protein SEC63 homolog n=1 Tax=Acropora digitifera TaxID=70779 RepID=UPI00077A2FC4|nr:PREDICTED: translocation protein SEC63 homolog [Acropora digitifera]
MAGAQFEYDEKGTTFYYFLLSFFGIVLVPLTYYIWKVTKLPDSQKIENKICQCPPCEEKREALRRKKPKSKSIRYVSLSVLAVLWVLFFVGAYKISQFEKDFTEYDPYAVLELDRGSSTADIRRQYRRLSMKYHPDKETGDPQKFMRIAKAYEALTNEESRKNWEEHGNPDGPGATSFGIALPSWLVSKENSMWVLGAYGLAFMVILPIAVGTWWYKSIQYSCEQILLDTTQLYYYFFHKTPSMHVKRVLMILGGSLEFEKGHNREIQERPSDNIELPELMRDLTNLGDKNKEPPLCYPYSIKARALIHAHLSRLELPRDTLKPDLDLILRKSTFLIQEMVSCVVQLIAMAKAGRELDLSIPLSFGEDEDSDAPQNDAGARYSEDEDEWDRLQADSKNRDNILDAKSKESHVVHAPYFPEEKQEWWWIYVTDRKKSELITPPQQIFNLKDEEKLELKFQAPNKPRSYHYTVMLRSDSYLNVDVQKTFDINVEQAKEVNTKQWDFESDEEDKDDLDESGESEEEEYTD